VRPLRDHERLLAPLVLGLMLLVLLRTSDTTAPSIAELLRFEAVDAAGEVVRQVARRGLAELRQPASQLLYSQYPGESPLFVLLGSWSRLSFGRLGLLDVLTSARLPWLLWSAAGIFALYSMVCRAWGRSAGLLAALILCLLPAWLHGIAVRAEYTLIGSGWLVALAAHQRVRCGSRRLGWSIATALLLGLAVVLSRAAVWALLLMLLHELRWRDVQRGRVRLPLHAWLALGLVPLVVIVLNPALWEGRSVLWVRWALAVVAPEDPAHGGGLWRLGASLPLSVIAAAVVGIALGVRPRSLLDEGRSVKDGTGLTVLGLWGLGATALGIAIGLLPPYWPLLLPFVAVFVAAGLAWMVRQLGSNRGAVALLVTLTPLVMLTVRSPSTRAAAVAGWLGGTLGFVDRGISLGDGSELAALVPQFEGEVALLGGASMTGTQVLARLQEAGRLGASVKLATQGRSLLRGPAAAACSKPEARVERGGQILWAVCAEP